MLMLYFLMIAFVGPLCARYLERRAHASLLTAAGALIPGLAMLVPAAHPTLLTTSAAVILCGVGAGMNNGPQVSIAMEIAETELAHLGSNTVLGALRSLERGGSILGLLVIASIAGAAGYQAALGAMAVWTLAGFALFAAVAVAADGRKLLRKPSWP
jgi:MFS family permease